MKIKFLLLLTIVACGLAFNASALKTASTQYGLISAVNQANLIQSQRQGEQNSSVTIDFSAKVGESWDEEHDANNAVASCIKGSVVTGIEWSGVKLETVGTSWLSEATILLSDSSNGQGIRLAIADADSRSGVETYSSNGILDFTDEGVDDIIALADGKFPIQFFEQSDDATDAIDAYYTAGTITIWGENLITDTNCEYMTVASSDLSLEIISDAQDDLKINDEIAFSLTIDNIGGASAANISVFNTLKGLHFVDASCGDGGSVGTNDNNNVVINIDNLGVGSSVICTVNTKVSAFGDLSYTSSVTASNDSISSNNSASLLLRGPAYVIPVNNWLALLLLMLMIFLFAQKYRTN